mgnify:FL=1|tara:strand:+ start:1530 stop:1775 length:246 start_codon:yes stop_codon:yes gene_type:complete
MRKKLISFLCSDNADDEIWHQDKASKLLEKYRIWFDDTKFKYEKDYRYVQMYRTEQDMMKFYIFADITHPKLKVLFKLRWL